MPLSAGNPFSSLIQPGTNSGADNTSSSVSQGSPFASLVGGTSVPSSNSISNPGQSSFWDAIDVINRNFGAVANGSLQTIGEGLGKLGLTTASNNLQRNVLADQANKELAYQQALKNSPITGHIVDAISKFGAAASSPGSQALMAGSLGTNLAGRILSTAGASAIAGGEQFIQPGSNESRADNAIGSGLIGGGLQAGGEALASGLGAAAKYGAQKLFSTPVQEAADSVDKGLLTTVGSSTGNPVLQKTEQTLGGIPLAGAGNALEAGTDALRNETQKTLSDIGAGLQNKQNLADTLQSEITNQFNAAKANTDSAYKAAFDIAKSSKLDIPLTQTQDIAKQAISDIQSLNKEGITTNLSSKPGQLLSDLANMPNGTISAENFDPFRKKLNGVIDNLSKSGNEDGMLGTFQQIRSAMDSDLDSVASKNPEFADALKSARDIFINQKLPFQNTPVLKDAVAGNLDTDQLMNNIVKNNRPALTQKIMDQLSPEGKNTFGASIIQKAVDNSITKTGDGISQLDLGKFTTNIHKLGSTIEALPDKQQAQIQGLQRLLTRGDSMIKADKAGMNQLLTGMLGSVSGGSLALGGLSALPGILGAAGVTKLFSSALTSPTITRGLIKLAGGKLSSTAEEGLIKQTLGKILNTGIQGGIIPAISSNIKS